MPPNDDADDPDFLLVAENLIGIGNTGVVVRSSSQNRVKKLPAPWQTDYVKQIQRTELRREIAIYRHLPPGHPRLVRMLDCEDDGADRVSITLEYMPHNSIHNYLLGGCCYTKPSPEELARGQAIPPWQRASWALEAVDGVAMLHAYGVVHADLKPANMLLDDGLHVRLIDLSGSALGDLPSLCLGSSPFYMPRTPANCNGHMDCSVTTDLFALGSSFYQIETGREPWDGVDHLEIPQRYADGHFPDLVTAGPDGSGTPLRLADVIDRCWHGRYASATDLLAALREAIRAEFRPDECARIQEHSGLLDEASLQGNGANV